MTVRSLITVAGSVAGAIAFSNPVTVAAVALGSAVLGGFLDPVETKVGSPLKDNLNNSTALGRVLPIFYGTYPWDQPFWVYKQPFKVQKSTKRSGLFTKVTTTKNLATFSRGICEGQRTVLKMWYAGELVYDVTNAGGKISGRTVLNGGTGRFGFGPESTDGRPVDFEEALFGLDTPGYIWLVREVVNDMYVDRWGGIPEAKYLVSESTTDAFLFEQVDESTLSGGFSTSTSRALWYIDRRHFITDNSNVGGIGPLIKWDSLTRTRLVQDVSPEGSRLEISPFDNSIFTMRTTDGSRKIYKIDPETLRFVARSEPGITGTSTRVLGIGGTSASPRAFYHDVNTMYVYNPDVVTGSVFDTTYNLFLQTFLFIGSYDLDDFIGLIGTATAATADGDGNFWVSFNISGEPDARLIKYHFASGAPVETHVLTDINDTTVGRIGYDPGTNSLFGEGLRISDGEQVIFKFSLDTLTITGEYEEDGAWSLGDSTFKNTPVDSKIYQKLGSAFVEIIDLTTMTLDRTLDLRDWPIPGAFPESDYNFFIYDETQDAIVSGEAGLGHEITWVYLDRVAAGDTSVKLITENLSERLGLSITDDVDASAGITQTFRGYAIDSQQPAANDVAEINTLFFNTIRPHDGKTQLVTRGGGVDKVLDNDLLGAVPADSAVGPPFTESEGQEREILPAQFILNYKDPAKDYEARNQAKRRDDVTIATEHAETLTTKAAITAQQAADWVVRMEALARAGRKEFELGTVLANLLLEPGDVFQISDDTSVLRLFAEETELTQEGVYKLKARTEEAPIFSFTGDADVFTGLEDTITIFAASFLNVLDVPHVQSGLQSLALHVVAGPTSDNPWLGHEVTETPDGGSEPGAFADVDPGEAVQRGFLSTVLPVGKLHGWDRVNNFTFTLHSGVLAAQTEQQVLALNSGGTPVNGLWVESDDGTWEVVLFSGVTDNGDGTWTVGGTGVDQGLLRGMYNTEEAMNAGHSISQRVYVIPDVDNIIAQEIPSSWLSAARTFIGFDPDTDVQSSVKILDPVNGCSQKPYPVREIEGSVDGSNNWDVTFRRQGRNMGASISFSVVPQGVTTLNFVARIYNGTTLVRTITATASAGGSVITVDAADTSGIQTLEYTAADQDTDFGVSSAPLRSIDIGIAQIDENGNEGPERRVLTAGDIHWDSVVLLCWFNGEEGQTTTADRSGNHTLTVNGNVTLTKVGNIEGALNCPGGTGDNVTTPASTDWDLGTADFTIEAQITTSTGAVQGIVARGTTAATSRWSLRADNQILFLQNSTNHLVGTTSVVDSIKHHIAISRNSGTTRLFIDGVEEDSTTTVFDITADAVNDLTIGDEELAAGREFLGQIDDLRITKGVGRYPSNFTPPIAELPADV